MSDPSDETETTPDAGTVPDWRESVPEELRRFAANLATPADAVKMAAGLRQKLSRAIVPPGPDSSDQEIAEFHRRLGVPERPEDYGIAYTETVSGHVLAGEQSAEDEAAFLKAMHDAGASREVVQAAVDWYGERVCRMHDEAVAAQERERRSASEALRRDWGPDYERNFEFAIRAVHNYGGEALVDRLELAGLGNDPTLLRAFYCIGQDMAEDEVFREGGAADTRRDLEERARALRSRPDRWTNAKVDAELRDIMERLHGTQPVQPRR